MTSSGLVADVEADIRDFIARQDELMFNEIDFQIQLAIYLRGSGRYDDVDVEYSMPRTLIDDYDWKSNLRIDIVVSRSGEYCPVELKYPTKGVTREIKRFGKFFPDTEVMKNHGAQDLVRYNYWKDVRRIELLRRIFDSVHGGLAVLLTNDMYYTRPVRATSAAAPFSTHEGRCAGGGTMDWNGNPAVRPSHPSFTLDGVYAIRWTDAQIDGVGFKYTIVKV
ncbi:MAG: hypothetical protein K2L77_03215 [Muribaculaceae bacterium]|nr:hypothetical protein [Muribaculaceae bacterium]